MFILQHQDKDTELDPQIKFEDKMQVFDNIMVECKDVLQIVKDELGSEISMKKKNKLNISQLTFIKSYLSYFRLV